jgi:hypothetical protein
MDFPVELIGCPLMKKTLEAAEGGRSFIFVVLGVNLGGRKDKSDCAVVRRLAFVDQCDGGGLK